MIQAKWNGKVIAQTDQAVIIEGNYYFPPDSIKKEYFKPSSYQTHCPWKGQASYYSLEVDGKQNLDAAWRYLNPLEKAKHIQGFVAFWKDVEVSTVN